MARTRSHTTDRRHACPHRLIWVIWVATELLAAPAWGHGELIPQDGFYLSPGLGLGLDRGSGAGGLALGGALHLTRFDNGLKWGLDAEGWYDRERAAARILMAPSAGLGPYGIDAGYLVELPEGGAATA